MRSLLVAAATVALAASTMVQGAIRTSDVGLTPVDIPCVTWEPWDSNKYMNNPDEYFVAAHTYVTQFGPEQCDTMGDIFPCFASKHGVWGHHDYNAFAVPTDVCRVWADGGVTFDNNFYLPKKGPKYQTWKWHTVSVGDPVPDNVIRFGESVMARSAVSPPGQCAGKGFTGWAVGQKNGTFGDVHFSIVQQPFTTNTFEVAICEAYKPTPEPPTPAPTLPPTPVPTTTQAPTTTTAAPSTISPTLPPNNKPYIRFANTVPSANKITATITQGNTTYTWTDYAFGEFSKWVEIFKANIPGTIKLVSGGKTLLETSVLLTPGPLVVAVKDTWPPVKPTSVETIAASYVPVASGSGARLFNLSPDTQAASMSSGGKTLAQDIIYADGSVWAAVPVGSADYTVSNFVTNEVLAKNTFSAPPAPFVFTNFLIGLSNTTESAYKTQLVALVDAPEF